MRSLARLVLAASLPALLSAQSNFDAAVKAGEKLPRLHSILVSRHGEILLEHYYRGTKATSYENVKSASKSVISALIGSLVGSALIGWLFDRWFGTAPWALIVMLFLGIGVAFRQIIRISGERPE